jgi:hypothetical protein
MNKEEFNKLYEELKQSKFRQQKFPGWRPLPTISCITIIFIVFGILCIIIGILILIFTGMIKEYKYHYKCSTECSLSPIIPEEMKSPIMIYYQIDDFRENHRFYMDNKNDKQLKGEEVSKSDLEKSGECENSLYIEDFREYGISIPSSLSDNDIAFPCGLKAKSYFQDEITEFKIFEKEVEITTEDIAYKKDIDTFSKIEFNPNKHWTDMAKEQFMIWMRVSPFENPRKLWAKIKNTDIKKDSTISIKIKPNSLYTFDKYIILSTRNVFGGKSLFLGICYIVFGGVCLLSAVIFINVYNYFHKKEKK